MAEDRETGISKREGVYDCEECHEAYRESMRFEFKPSFDRSIKVLNDNEKIEVKKSAIYAVDVLSQERMLCKGIGLKHLKDNYWELRRGLRVRILFRWKGGLVEFILAGNHDDIKRYLKNV
jgi:hypothetical protein